MDASDSQRYDLFAEALSDYYHKRPDPPHLFLVREDGFREELPAAFFFTGYGEFSPLEKKVIDAIDGSTLDVGAGAGRHSLVLMERGVDVTALEIEPLLVDIMRQRGLKKVVRSDIFNFEPEIKFRNILFLAHGLGMAGNLSGLLSLLHKLLMMLEKGGKIYADSVDIAMTKEKHHLDYQEKITGKGRYRGEIRMYLEYGNRTGGMINWLLVDFDTLGDLAGRAGLGCTLFESSPHGEFVVEMSSI